MERRDAELEIFEIAKAVGHAFEHLDLVVDAFDGARGDRVVERVEETPPVGGDLVGEGFDEGDAAAPCFREPLGGIRFCRGPIAAAPGPQGVRS